MYLLKFPSNRYFCLSLIGLLYLRLISTYIYLRLIGTLLLPSDRYFLPQLDRHFLFQSDRYFLSHLIGTFYIRLKGILTSLCSTYMTDISFEKSVFSAYQTASSFKKYLSDGGKNYKSDGGKKHLSGEGKKVPIRRPFLPLQMEVKLSLRWCKSTYQTEVKSTYQTEIKMCLKNGLFYLADGG